MKRTILMTLIDDWVDASILWGLDSYESGVYFREMKVLVWGEL